MAAADFTEFLAWRATAAHNASITAWMVESEVALKRLVAARYPLDGASDHGVIEAIYLSDPDGNGVELYRDRPEADWPRDAAGELKMVTAPLDLQALLADAE